MSDNVIKFQRKPQPKPPRQTPPWLKRVLTVVAVAVALVAIWAYFQFAGGSAPPTPSAP